MRNREIAIIKPILTMVFLWLSVTLYSQEINFEGQAIGWVATRYNDIWAVQAGSRFIPEISFKYPTGRSLFIEGEFSANATGSITSPTDGDKLYGRIKPYRAWLKIGSDQFEIRAGLQKINFGSASMLRSLMWFDRIDPRDPLQLTDGVYSVLGRYYFLNNANIWIWGLYGNRGTKGWEYLESNSNRPEFGGRIQVPIPGAEIAFTYNNREIRDTLSYISNSPDPFSFKEQKFAFDIKADLVLGIWTEGVVKYSNTDLIPSYQKMITLGADYTFGLGNGLLLSAEYLGLSISDRLTSETESNLHFIGISASYPISIVTGISAIAYYNPATNDLYRFVNFTFSFDRFSFYMMGFWNPSNYQLLNINSESTMFNGTGIQVMAVFNY